MPYPDNLLARGERVLVNKNPHWKVLILPVIFFLLIVGGGIALLIWLQDWQHFNIAWIVIAIVMLVGLIWLVLVPVIRWRTEHFAISNHHVFFRTGLLSRREHQIPLGQIANMETEVTFWGRLMGYGTLVVESSADAPLKFHNIAELPKTQATLNQLIRDEREAYSRGRWGEDDDPADGPDVSGELPEDQDSRHRSRRQDTYLDDGRVDHPEPRSTPTRAFGAAPGETAQDRPQQYDAPHQWPAGQPRYAGPQTSGGQPQYGASQQYGAPQAPAGLPQYGAPQHGYGTQQPASQQYQAPQQYGAPQQAPPPQYGAPQSSSGRSPYGQTAYDPSGQQQAHSGQPQYQQPQNQQPQYQPPSGHRQPDRSDPPTDPWLNRPAGPRPNPSGTAPSGTDGADGREP